MQDGTVYRYKLGKLKVWESVWIPSRGWFTYQSGYYKNLKANWLHGAVGLTELKNPKYEKGKIMKVYVERLKKECEKCNKKICIYNAKEKEGRICGAGIDSFDKKGKCKNFNPRNI